MDKNSYIQPTTEQNIKCATARPAILGLTLTFDPLCPLKNPHSKEGKEVVESEEKGSPR